MEQIRFACLTFCLFVFFVIETKGQYYVMDTIPQEYEIISIQKSRKARLENCTESIKKSNEIIKSERELQQYYRKAQKLSSIKFDISKSHMNTLKKCKSSLKKLRYQLKNPQYNKNGYVLLLKHIKTGDLFDVAVVKKKQMEGETLQLHKVYSLKLYKVKEIDVIKECNPLWWIDMDGSNVSIIGKSWTRNIYVSPNLKGLKYNPQADFSDNSQTNSDLQK